MRHVLKSIGAFAVLAVLAGGLTEVAAHHSAAMFDFSKMLKLKGKVVEMRWVNPHVTITIMGSPSSDEAPSEWLMETTSPGNLTRVGGWRRDIIKPGDEIEVSFHPEREAGKKNGLLREMKLLSTGEVFPANIRDQEKPGLE
ncbi:MAG TPA: DUF6152 family protein [Bradyrhizobium sp.]|uniref:DUF6152 family protein n=1 Tax=Bradyrhizobium sp. TaxID=376 RepID=UPI002D80967C|nr:DUF6152 family protein [Bradyrhizobium sp.]HET7887436.1 DUF6152 family protein [Bradyrhizobium sp.]